MGRGAVLRTAGDVEAVASGADEQRVEGSTGSVVKRVLVGRAFTSANLEHTLLPKVLALPVFASDALSSVAYATGEILSR